MYFVSFRVQVMPWWGRGPNLILVLPSNKKQFKRRLKRERERNGLCKGQSERKRDRTQYCCLQTCTASEENN